MTGPLFHNLNSIGARVTAAAGVLLFLDFDGTLSPIVDIPEKATLPDETRDILIRLNRRPRFNLALISGRSLADVEQRVGLPDLIYAGNHGLEIRATGLRYTEPAGEKNPQTLLGLS